MPRDRDESLHDQTDFARITARLSRRGFLGGTAAGLGAMALGTTALTSIARADGRFGFEAIPASTEDTVVVAQGYSWHPVVSWGDPMWSNGAAFDDATRGTGQSQELAFGDNNDGMSLFTDGSRTVLAVNNEYVNIPIIHGNRASGAPEDADDVKKGIAAHGVSVVEIAEVDGKWQVVVDSGLNRRITADTPMEIAGPARGHDLMKTAADASGTTSLGTWNNCANGRTPWGTYLTCEENFDDVFGSSDAAFVVDAAMERYGIGLEDDGYGWYRFDERFDISKNPNEPNRAGYVVEIDPLDPSATPKKRTALGRFKHENAEVVIAQDGRIVVYMGDDERGEFLYRFVTDRPYMVGGDNSDLLDGGVLSVAVFADDMTGRWVDLTPKTTGMASAAEIAIHTRQAASAVGATTMDRPEWIAANPNGNDVYCALTNNKNRAVKTNAGGDETLSAAPTRARKTTTARSCAGGPPRTTTPARLSPGTSSSSRATRRCTRTPMPARTTSPPTTCSTRPTAWPSTARACCGSRPTATTATRVTSPAWATTRCCSPTPRRARSAASWWARRNAR